MLHNQKPRSKKAITLVFPGFTCVIDSFLNPPPDPYPTFPFFTLAPSDESGQRVTFLVKEQTAETKKTFVSIGAYYGV